MSQSCFSLGFLSQNSLWKLSTFRGYRRIYSRVYEEWEKSCFNQTGHSGDSTSQLERVVSQSRDPVSRFLWLHTSWVFFTHSHTQPLHKSHLNTGYLIAKLQANLAQNKANTWLNKFNLTSYHNIKFHDQWLVYPLWNTKINL